MSRQIITYSLEKFGRAALRELVQKGGQTEVIVSLQIDSGRGSGEYSCAVNYQTSGGYKYQDRRSGFDSKEELLEQTLYDSCKTLMVDGKINGHVLEIPEHPRGKTEVTGLLRKFKTGTDVFDVTGNLKIIKK